MTFEVARNNIGINDRTPPPRRAAAACWARTGITCVESGEPGCPTAILRDVIFKGGNNILFLGVKRQQHYAPIFTSPTFALRSPQVCLYYWFCLRTLVISP